jgi:hypothetical protein
MKAADLQSEPDAVHHEPCGLLSHADGAVNFVATYPILAIGNHPTGNQPVVQRDWRVLENRIDPDGELPLGVL